MGGTEKSVKAIKDVNKSLSESAENQKKKIQEAKKEFENGGLIWGEKQEKNLKTVD